jgi:hypothetical protein
MTLLQETISLLKADTRTRDVIARETDLGRDWLSKLAQGLIDDPGVNKIEKLNAYLKGAERAA